METGSVGDMKTYDASTCRGPFLTQEANWAPPNNLMTTFVRKTSRILATIAQGGDRMGSASDAFGSDGTKHSRWRSPRVNAAQLRLPAAVFRAVANAAKSTMPW